MLFLGAEQDLMLGMKTIRCSWVILSISHLLVVKTGALDGEKMRPRSQG